MFYDPLEFPFVIFIILSSPLLYLNRLSQVSHFIGRFIVVAAPWVTADETYQPVRLGKDANITCRYDAEPPPLVDWLYNSFKINFSDEKFRNMIQYGTRVDNSSLSILSVKNIREDNFGDYTCRVANHLGKKEITIHVSGRPGPPILNLSGTVLSWRVQSIDPIVEYQIMYRLANDDTWQQSKSIRASKDEQDGDVWSQSEDLIWLTPGLEYEIQLKARNTLGWGSLARSYLTVTIPPVKETADASGCDQSYSFFFAVLFIVPSVLLLTSL
ncbi:hypothetical protein AB6A40_008810 [Gnathostoma spinigerum]|uniref:Ig-like domain-containing protein n=1 Tax=Gnathostoma spinigerum TaxID=75299 RepID=A0ABD6EQI8_9BILA